MMCSTVRGVEEMKRILIYILIPILIPILLFLLCLLAAVVIMFTNPLAKSEEQIKESLLELTPIGTSLDDVLDLVKSKIEWRIKRVNYGQDGYGSYARYNQFSSSLNRDDLNNLKSIKVYIGEYFNIFMTSVHVKWEFDENSKLNDIEVTKYVNSF